MTATTLTSRCTQHARCDTASSRTSAPKPIYCNYYADSRNHPVSAQFSSRRKHRACSSRVRATARRFGNGGLRQKRAQNRSSLQVVGYTLPGGDDNEGKFEWGLTKTNELFLGRISMFTFGTSVLSEHFTGKGLLSLLNFETGIPIWETEPVILSFIVFQIATGLAPAKGTFSAGGTISGSDAPAAEGQSADFNFAASLLTQYALLIGNLLGMTKERELLVGRVAQIGLAASLIGEVLTGDGPLEQLQIETGVDLLNANPIVIIFAASFLLIAISDGTGKFTDGE